MDNKTMIYTNCINEEIEVNLIVDRYINSNALYLGLVDKNGELYTDLTVNLPFYSRDFVRNNESYLDTNNSKYVEDFINKYKLGEFTGIYSSSGFCEYPLYEFNIEQIKKYCNFNDVLEEMEK